MTKAIILTSSDFEPLRSDLTSIGAAVDAVEQSVIAQAENRIRQQNIVDKVPGEYEGLRVALTAGDGVFTGMRLFGNPPNTRAFILFDGETRAMLAIMDYGVLNSLRVGSIAGVAAKHLAPAGARTVGLIGSGWQAPPQAAALRAAVPNLEKIRVYSPTKEHREAFAAQMTAALEISVEPVGSTEEALRDADIVDLCAPGHHDKREPLFELPWLKPGALVISMGANQTTGEFVQSSRLITSWHSLTVPAAKAPFDKLIESGALTKDDVTELGAVITGKAPARTKADENVLFVLEGGSANDFFVATWAYEWARARGLGQPFDLDA